MIAAPHPGAHVRKITGRCLCGAVELEVEDAFRYAAYCHCSRCRRRSGSAFNAFGGIEAEKLHVRVGAEQLARLAESAEGYNAHCKLCCSPLFAVVRGRQFAHVQLGALAEAPTKRPDHHIQVASKAAWYEINDGLPQYDEFAP
jgi:hypothetical protein